LIEQISGVIGDSQCQEDSINFFVSLPLFDRYFLYQKSAYAADFNILTFVYQSFEQISSVVFFDLI